MVKRPDRTSKLKQRGETEETVVKCSLNRLIQEDLKDKISAAIQKRVKECSERLNYGSISINLLIRKLFDGVEDVADVELPEFWDQTFVRQALIGLSFSSMTSAEPNTLVPATWRTFLNMSW